MAPKRNVRNIQVTAAANNNIINNYDKLLLSDVLCPICRTILIEPVTLPCNHGFCLSCFNNSMENTNLVCPLCRLRVSSWLRLSKKDNKLINKKFWEAIQKTFSQRVKDKLQGIEEYEEEEVQRQLTAVGEIRLEYEMEKAKELNSQHKEQEAEIKASEDYIKKLKEQEEYEECVREENLRLSEQLAKKLSNEYCFDPGPSSSKANLALSSVTNKKQVPIDRFLKNVQSAAVSKNYTCKVLNQNTVNASFVGKDLVKLMDKHVRRKFGKIAEDTSDSNDSIVSECRYFKPIDRKSIPLTTKVPIVKVPSVIANANTVIIGAPKGKTNFSHSIWNSAFAVVRMIFPVINSSDTSETEDVDHELEQQVETDTIDTTITEVNIAERPFTFNDNILNFNRRPLARPLASSSTNVNKSHTSVSNINKVDIVLQSISKRKRSISSPFDESINTKHAKVSDINLKSPVISNSIHSENTNCNSSDINKGISNHRQEDDDFKLAMKLHKELNNSNRYPVRNNISIRIRNTRKSARQVTLKEIISQAASS